MSHTLPVGLGCKMSMVEQQKRKKNGYLSYLESRREIHGGPFRRLRRSDFPKDTLPEIPSTVIDALITRKAS